MMHFKNGEFTVDHALKFDMSAFHAGNGGFMSELTMDYINKHADDSAIFADEDLIDLIGLQIEMSGGILSPVEVARLAVVGGLALAEYAAEADVK